MSKKQICAIFIPIAGGILLLAAACAAFLIFREKHKRDEEELERYLDGAIE